MKRWILAGLALLGLTAAALAPAQAADERPLLVVEQGAHSAPVRRIDVNARRGLVVTASDDRTARVWDLASGELRHVLRPLAFGAEGGRLYGAAIHPSEPLVAVAGTTGGEGHQHLIYLFDLESGALRRTIDARAGDVRKLVWSQDGTVLLAGYSGANGVRAFSFDGRPLFEERFEGPVFGLATASNGLAAAVSLDGRLRVYRAAASAVTAVSDTPLPNRRSAGVAFSPDGRQLAVAFADRGEAPEVFDAESGRSVAKLPPVPVRGGDFRVIAWSSDGRSLFTGGTAQSQAMGYPIVQYDVASRRAAGQTDVARDSVTDLAVLPSGELAYSSFDGSWGIFAGGKVARRVAADVSTVRGDTPEDLELSADARALRWGMQGTRGLGFQFDKRRVGLAPREALRVPETRFGLFNAPRDWKLMRAPQIGGKTLALAADESSRALVVARSTPAAAILGTNRALYRIGESGDVQWRMPVDTEIRAVNASSDGRLVVSAMADGTLRWWRASDGRHLLTLMVFADGRWVIWTPSGYYDASAGADQVVGWALGASQQQAMNYYSLNRFRERFNRPDVIDAVLKTLDEGTAFAALATQDEAARQAVQRDAQARAGAAQAAEREASEKAEQARVAALREAETRVAAEREARDTAVKVEQSRLAAAREAQARAAADRTAAERAAQEQAARAEQTRLAEARRLAAEAQAAREAATREAAQREAEARDTAAKIEQSRLAAAREAQARVAAERAAAERAVQEQAARAEQTRLEEARRLAAEAQAAREAATREAAQREAEARAAQEREIASRNAALEAHRLVARLEAAREAAAKDLAAKEVAAREAAREATEREAAAKARRALTELKASEFPPALLTFENKRLKAAAAEITLPFAVSSGGNAGEVTVEVRVNGRPARPSDLVIPKSLDGATRGFAKLPIGPGESIVEIIARNNFGASEPLSFRIEREVAAPLAPRAPAGPPGDLYILSIGVSDYARPDYKLGLAAKDAADFANAMRSQEGKLYRKVIVRTLTNKDATRANITREFDALSNAVGPADVAMLFMAGHGLNDTTGQYFFLPYDGNHERLLASAIPQSSIVSTLSRIRGKTLFFVDTCFAGNSLGALSRANRKTERMINDLSSSENGVVVFASSTGQEESEEKDEWGNGAFTKALIEGLAGKADFTRAGRVTFAALNLFVSEEVTRITEGRQRPVFISPRGIPDFALTRL